MDWIVTLTPDESADPLVRLASPPADAAVVELRLDLFPDIDVATARARCPLPILATCRSTAEGGRGPDDPVLRSRILDRARDGGAQLIDLEYRRDLPLIRQFGLDPAQLVLSWHDPVGTPPEIADIASQMLQTSARWVKVVPTATRLADLHAIISLQRRYSPQPRGVRRLICFGMGGVGVATRFLSPLLGPAVSFCAWPGHAAGAPGQLSAAAIDAVVGHLGGAPQLFFGVVGGDVSSSLSPAMHSAAYRALGMHHLFLPISVPDPEELPRLFDCGSGNLFHELGFTVGGWAVTAPYKGEAASFATHRAPRVERARAANTLLFRGAKVIAENTDADGVVGALTAAGIDPRGRRAVVLGAGGAARGAAVGLDLAGAEVSLCGRDVDAALRCATEIGVGHVPSLSRELAAHILVNATPLGGHADDPSPFEPRLVESCLAVVDMVYAEHPTSLMEHARSSGVGAIDGRAVLAHQGFAQFAAMNGMIPPRDEMMAALALP